MPETPTTRRPDIEGLRAVAVAMVVVYHVWIGRVSGGVDVFLFLSAFFLTGGLVRRLERGERVQVGRYWLRVFQRLVPAAAAVVLATVAAAFLVLPVTGRRALLVEAITSLTYTQNWLLAQRAVDYYAQDKGSASPLQHMWSLAIQGQVFLLWPLLLVALAAVMRRAGRGDRAGIRRGATVLFSLVLAASFAWAVSATATAQASAYFDTGARLWEFAAGSLLALAITVVRVPRPVVVPLGWAGLAAMLACGLVLDVGASFPGWAAWWPLLGAAAVVLAGSRPAPGAVAGLLGSRPLVALGGMSYAWYLVHWPVLVLFLAATGRTGAGALGGVAVIATSLVLAWLLTRALERPIRSLDWPSVAPRRSVALLASTVLLVAGGAGVGILRLDAQAERGDRLAAGEVLARHPGARSLDGAGAPALDRSQRLPVATALRSEFASLPQACTGQWVAGGPLAGTCSVLEPDQPPTATVLVIGDSHAEQWLPALEPHARENGWRLLALLKGSCSYGDPASRSGWCKDYNAAAREYAHRVRPDLVVTVSTAARASTPQERVVTGYEAAVRDLTADGIPVLGLRDNPRFTRGVVDCALREGDRACSAPVGEKLAARNPADRLRGIEGWTGIDLTDRICPDGTCPPAVGNVWVYLDDNHLTRSYAGTLAPVLGQRMRAAGVWPGRAPQPELASG